MTDRPIWNRLIVAGKVGTLLVTTALLMATSAPPDCDHRAAPVVFQAAGTCGPGGLIVVETQERNSTVTVANAAALGLPPLTPEQGISGRYVGRACPFTVEKGEWQFEWTCGLSAGGRDGRDGRDAGDGAGGNGVVGGDGGTDVDGGTNADSHDGGAGLTVSCLRSCVAHLGPNGELLLTCTGAGGELLCESRLTKVVLP